ncbi:MAG: multifunctional CCA addition/repair protein [Gammaproteobacteria bacterium]
MDIYLVGGAVRDKRRGLPVQERDWVVVGATPQQMLDLGYQPVGKDFPVFLHPQTKEEYALARTERKTGHGYTGFETCADPDISLEEDLLRRDLTINAMAETPGGELIDPYNGLDDLNNGVLRHVSAAFAEDPVRILRTARFAARFAQWGFHVAHTTNALMRRMVENGEADHLVAERVWSELVKALDTETPARFFRVLAGCGALRVLFPELAAADNRDQENSHTGDTLALPVLQQAVTLSKLTTIRFAALACDMDSLHPDGTGIDALVSFCERYRVPNACRDLARLALQQRRRLQAATRLSAEVLLELLHSVDAFRRPERFSELLEVCAADAAAAQCECNRDYLLQALAAARSVSADDLQQQGLNGKEIGKAIQQRRIEAIERLSQPTIR